MAVFKQNNLLSPHPYIFDNDQDALTALVDGKLGANIHRNPSQFSPKGVPTDYYNTDSIVFLDKRILKVFNKIEEPFLNADGVTWVQRSEVDSRNERLKNRSICQSISLYLPSRIEGGQEKNLITGLNTQWHGGASGTNPFCNITLEGGRIRLLTRWDATGFDTNYMWFDLGPATRNIWHHFIFYHELQYDINLGRRTVWHKEGDAAWRLARCHNPVTGEPWTVPTVSTSGVSNLYIAYPVKGTLPMVAGGVSLLDWHGFTWYNLPIDSIYFKWGKYKSGVENFYNSTGDPVNTTDPLDAYYIEPGSYDEVWFTNVQFGLLDVAETEGELFADLAYDDAQPMDHPSDMDFTVAAVTYTITFGASSPPEGGTAAQVPDQAHPDGSVVQLIASPSLGWEFVEWRIGTTVLPDSTSTYDYTITGDVTITPVFTEVDAPAVEPVAEEMELADNKIFRTVQANPANYAAGNYEMYGELRVEKTPGSGVFERTLTARLSPNSEDKATFELQDGMADFFPQPDLNPAAVTAVTMTSDNQVRAQFYTAESYGDPAVLQPLNLTGNMRVLNGGIPMLYDLAFFADYLPASKRFLTWHPGKKRVNQDQPELLHFYAYAGITSIKLLLKVYFSDQTSQTVIKSTTMGIQEGRIYRIPAGFTALQVNAVNPNKKPVKYEVWLRNQSDVIIASPMTYIIEEVPKSTSRFWMFLNSLGMWEIMRTEGRAFKTIGIDREMSAGYLQKEYSRTRGEIRSRVMGSKNEIEVSTGYLDSREEGEWAQEILLSDKVFLLENSLRIPYVVNTDDFEMSRDQDYRWFLRFRAQLAYNNVRFSRPL